MKIEDWRIHGQVKTQILYDWPNLEYMLPLGPLICSCLTELLKIAAHKEDVLQQETTLWTISIFFINNKAYVAVISWYF